MLDYLKTIATSVINFICDLLPVDGIQQYLSNLLMQGTAVLTGLSWLNWFVDVNGINVIMDIWLLAMGAYYAFKYGVNIFNGFANYLTNVVGLPEE